MTVPTTLAGDVDDTYQGVFCPDCGQDMDWIDCDLCGGEGYFDGETLMEEDPLWYGPDDIERCEQCEGKGGWWWCSNRECRDAKDTDA